MDVSTQAVAAHYWRGIFHNKRAPLSAALIVNLHIGGSPALSLLRAYKQDCAPKARREHNSPVRSRALLCVNFSSLSHREKRRGKRTSGWL